MIDIRHGDCLEVLRAMPDCSVDSLVTDPPYGLSFMGKKWDYDVPATEVWAECLRILKPGGHLLAFAGTRTQHRMAVRIEDAGFEIRDMIAWVYGSGFPKSLDVSKAIDKAAGVAFDAQPASGVGFMNAEGEGGYNVTKNQLVRKGDSTEAARQWQGWGTALKPALEPITVARKPLDGTVAANVQAHGTGAINVDGCRVDGGVRTLIESTASLPPKNALGGSLNGSRCAGTTSIGRWPANLIHDGSEEVLGLFPVTTSGSGIKSKAGHSIGLLQGDAAYKFRHDGNYCAGDSGSAARFFYCAKASKKDREGSTHPTMKPTDLMRYLCRLVTPPEGIVLDPFMGSGSTGKAAVLEGFQFIGIERDPQYVEIARARVAAARRESQQPALI